MQRQDGQPAVIDFDIIQDLDLDRALASPIEQGDGLIVWVGDHQPSVAESAEVPVSEVSAWIGTQIVRDNSSAPIAWLLAQTNFSVLVEQRNLSSGQLGLRLTMSGWERYAALKRAEVVSRTAFMAMQFGDSELNHIVLDCFRPAVERAGFELRLLTDRQSAGLIDDQLRVALRTARFVLADLSHGNNGAYWEAGFAEGLGRPVIYTCRKSAWGDKQKVHFDTNHLVTIIWEADNLEEAGDRLTATIRATLPDAARLTD